MTCDMASVQAHSSVIPPTRDGNARQYLRPRSLPRKPLGLGFESCAPSTHAEQMLGLVRGGTKRPSLLLAPGAKPATGADRRGRSRGIGRAARMKARIENGR